MCKSGPARPESRRERSSTTGKECLQRITEPALLSEGLTTFKITLEERTDEGEGQARFLVRRAYDDDIGFRRLTFYSINLLINSKNFVKSLLLLLLKFLKNFPIIEKSSICENLCHHHRHAAQENVLASVEEPQTHADEHI